MYHNLLIHLAVDGHVFPFPSALLEIAVYSGWLHFLSSYLPTLPTHSGICLDYPAELIVARPVSFPCSFIVGIITYFLYWLLLPPTRISALQERDFCSPSRQKVNFGVRPSPWGIITTKHRPEYEKRNVKWTSWVSSLELQEPKMVRGLWPMSLNCSS